MIQCARIVHAVKDGSDKVFQTPNLQSVVNKQNENMLTALLVAQINFLADDLAIACTVKVPEVEQQTGRLTQKIDTVILPFPESLLTKILTLKEKEAVLQRANTHYRIVQKILQFQTANDVDMNTTETLPIPNIQLEGG